MKSLYEYIMIAEADSNSTSFKTEKPGKFDRDYNGDKDLILKLTSEIIPEFLKQFHTDLYDLVQAEFLAQFVDDHIYSERQRKLWHLHCKWQGYWEDEMLKKSVQYRKRSKWLRDGTLSEFYKWGWKMFGLFVDLYYAGYIEDVKFEKVPWKE